MLSKTPELERVANSLWFVEPTESDWDELVEGMISKEHYSLSNFAGWAAEEHIRRQLQRNPSVKFREDEIFYNAEYAICPEDNRMVVTNTRGMRLVEYDAFTEIDGQKVVFEIKLRKYPAGGPNSRRVSTDLVEENIDRVLNPVRSIFGYEPGLVFVIDPGQLFQNITCRDDFQYFFDTGQLVDRRIGNRETFLNSGGLLIPFYQSRYLFREEVRSRLENKGLEFHSNGCELTNQVQPV